MTGQREWDIMQLESEIKLRQLFEEWRRGFLEDRLPQPQLPIEEEENLEIVE